MNKQYAINDPDFKKFEGKNIIEGIVDFAFIDREYDCNSINNKEEKLHCKFMIKDDPTLKPLKKLWKGCVSAGDYVGFVLKPYSGFSPLEDVNSVIFLKKYDDKTGEVLAIYEG